MYGRLDKRCLRSFKEAEGWGSKKIGEKRAKLHEGTSCEHGRLFLHFLEKGLEEQLPRESNATSE